MDANVVITGARVDLDDGTTVALIEAVTIGGGMRTVGHLHGEPVEEPDPVFRRFHVRLLSPDRMIADGLREAETYEEAVEIGVEYAQRRAKHAQQLADAAADLGLA